MRKIRKEEERKDCKCQGMSWYIAFVCVFVCVFVCLCVRVFLVSTDRGNQQNN